LPTTREFLYQPKSTLFGRAVEDHDDRQQHKKFSSRLARAGFARLSSRAMSELLDIRDSPVAAASRWPRRYTIAALFFFATVLCYLDRVSISVAIIPLAADEGYDSAAQGLILSAFFWGYLWPQLAGGWLADRFGGKRVLAFGVAVWSVATFITPGAARTSFTVLFAVRILLGLGEGVNFPAIHSLTARWMPPRERARILALNFSGMYLGTVVALIFSPLIIAMFGWPALFYLSGAVGVAWLAIWSIKADDGPPDPRPWSDRPTEERCDTAREPAHHTAPTFSRPASIPWRAIAREPAVWAIALAHFCSNFGFNILLLWLPTYLHHAFGVTVRRVGIYSLVPWVVSFAVVNTGGWVADAMLIRGVSVGLTRKVMQSIAFGVGALPLLAVPWAGSPAAATALLTLSAAASALGMSAYGVNHLDVGPEYAGVLMGISNSIATVPGIVGVAIAGFIVQATGSFGAVFVLIAAVYAIGLAGYVRWASGDRRL
jgi:MFS transporter, ACS family, solute carrier family 17 (sodium-dependent inorganic phosphate cotransporter), other